MFKNNKLLMTLPRELMITGAQAPPALADHPAVLEARKSTPELQPSLPVVLALLTEDAAGPHSFFAPYLATLPHNASLRELHLEDNLLAPKTKTALKKAAEERDGLVITV